jgi:hypothetical protein
VEKDNAFLDPDLRVSEPLSGKQDALEAFPDRSSRATGFTLTWAGAGERSAGAEAFGCCGPRPCHLVPAP